MKIAIISDLHLGFRQYGSIERENDFYNHFYKICQEINSEKNIDMVIIAGDLFDKPNPSPAAINAYREGVCSLKADIICAIKGNHTMLLRDNHYSIDEYFDGDEIEGYYLLDDKVFTTHDFALSSPYDNDFKKYSQKENIRVDGITYRTNSNIEDFLRVQKELSKKNEGEDYRILVLHQSFKEFCGFTGEELSIDDINYSSYDAIICGHIHQRMDTKLNSGTWFIQPGSIERMNTVEALDEQKNGKGFYILDTKENSVVFHKVECDRKFFLGNKDLYSQLDFTMFRDTLSKNIAKCNIPPIISYSFHLFDENIKGVFEYIHSADENVLLNKSQIYDDTQKETFVEISEEEVPTIINMLKKSCEKNFDEDEVNLSVDLYQALNSNKEDADVLLSEFLQDKMNKIDIKKSKDKDLEEFINF